MKKLLSAILLLSLQAQAARFVVESKHALTEKELKTLSKFKVERFSSKRQSVFNRTLVVSGAITKEELIGLPWVAFVEAPTEIAKLSLEPATTDSDAVKQGLIKDVLYGYQWGLNSLDQVFYREKDDIRNLPMSRFTGLDMRDPEAQTRNRDVRFEAGILPNIPSKKVIVAVLDSGIDLAHPELASNLWHNEGECGKDPKVDNDGNKLPGDCNGWNFTEDLNSEAAKSVQDKDGHGTHVSGIIGAALNEEGIVGVNPNVSILPIKVIKDGNSNSEIHSSESFARGIVYATDMGAAVINMSLGWPRALETKLLRDAVFYALGQGVVIVAAAGNNNSAEPLFPCAYDGVICAAASTLNGDFAGFSNYGSHIDTIAPGEGILSTIPTEFEPEFFSVNGYDLKSGTSQAAPLVAGMISILKAQDKSITIDEILGRLYEGKTRNKKKYILGGEATWDSLSRKIETPVVRPIMKRVRQIVLQGERPETRLVIPLRNYGVPAESIEVSMESLSPGLSVVSETLNVAAMKTSEVKELPFNLRVTDLYAESNVKIKVTIKLGESSQSFINEIPVVRDFRADPGLKKFGFTFQKNPLPVGAVRNGQLFTLITTIGAYVPSKKHEFYLKRTLEVEKKKVMELTVIAKKGEKYVEAPKPILINDATTLINFQRVDLNADGKEDYLVQSIVEEDNKKSLMFSFFNDEMETLWPKFQNVKVIFDTTISPMGELSFIKLNHVELGNMMVPAFLTTGQIPKADQVISSWQRLDPSIETRLYYLEPSVKEKSFRIRSYTTNVWKDQIKKSLNTKWYETVLVEQILPTTTADAKAGKVRFFFSVGQGTKRQLFIASVSGKDVTAGKALPQIVVQTEGVDSLYAVTPNGLETVGDVYMNIYDRSRTRVITTKDVAQSGEFVYRHEAETDILSGHLVSFENGNSRFTVLQSREELIGVSVVDKKIKVTKRPKLRYSFLTARVLAEMYNPVIYKRGGRVAPALYVDSTAVTANRLNLFEEQNGALVSSIKNSLTLPATCKAMNPTFNYESETSQFVFLCLDEAAKEWFVRTLDMN